MAKMKQGVFTGQDGVTKATVDATPTIRTTSCSMLTDASDSLCHHCKLYGSTLRAMYSRWKHRSSTVSKYTNNRYLLSPQKSEKIKQLQKRATVAENDVRKLQETIKALTEGSGVSVEEDLHDDLFSIMSDNHDKIQAQFPDGSFRRLFWEQQFKSAQKDPRQMRWHPTMIRWCLNLKLLSSSAYHAVRTSGFIKLPSERTLRDYTHFFKSKPGFQMEVDIMLKEEIQLDDTTPDWKKYVVLLLDEIKIKESLVYDKNSGQVIGFADLDDINDTLTELERSGSVPAKPIATHVLGLMVRGVFTSCKFPYAHFLTRNLTGDQLFSVAWEAVERLERAGLKVIAITADGASPNRKMFRMNSNSTNPLCYKTRNPYSKEREIFFISDVPHLMKTTRNCWAHSSSKGTRSLWINGKGILWQHLRCLYDAKISLSTRSNGLYLLKKLSKEHIDLTSYGKMKVNLAAQVLSESVANAFEFYGDPATTETQRFVRKFDAFFDCLNGRSSDEHFKHRKENLKPYTSPTDKRLEWLEKDFLGYLKEWKRSVESREGYTDGEKTFMLLSQETLEGLHITVKSFVELTRYLLNLPGMDGKYILSERFSQDPLENHFGRLRAHGGWCENPTAQACISAAQSLRVQGSLAMMPVRGNSSRKCRHLPNGEEKIDDTPLPKRKRKSSTTIKC